MLTRRRYTAWLRERWALGSRYRFPTFLSYLQPIFRPHHYEISSDAIHVFFKKDSGYHQNRMTIKFIRKWQRDLVAAELAMMEKDYVFSANDVLKYLGVPMDLPL